MDENLRVHTAQIKRLRFWIHLRIAEPEARPQMTPSGVLRVRICFVWLFVTNVIPFGSSQGKYLAPADMKVALMAKGLSANTANALLEHIPEPLFEKLELEQLGDLAGSLATSVTGASTVPAGKRLSWIEQRGFPSGCGGFSSESILACMAARESAIAFILRSNSF